ncbi:hypothetical protein G1J88_11480 [Tenacibaculum dicentrarchi]|nr:hypothetical protein [Tenacibaculum dicentrarchi]MCD8421248.1 hypothetical protein [Tenacibaculum dicentrarchi]MCG8829001.1 hypothetical protein [Tenacibaculum dicentrarchi]
MNIKEKYPNAYFDHWIAMLATTGSELNDDGIKEQIEMYKNFEGEDEFNQLQKELKIIINNQDIAQFTKVANNYGLNKLKTEHLQLIAEQIVAE